MRLSRCLATIVLTIASFGAMAQSYPNRPLRLVVPYAPGGAVDAFARPMAQKLTEQLGQSVIVENRPGGNATIGADAIAKAAPDGYSIVLTSINHYIVPFFSKNVPYDPIKDFTPIIIVCNAPNILAVHPSVPVQSMKELIEYARKNPGKLYYGTTGVGSTHHLAGLNEEIRKAINAPEVKSRLEGLGFVVTGNTPAQFDTQLRTDTEVFRKIVASAGIKPE